MSLDIPIDLVCTRYAYWRRSVAKKISRIYNMEQEDMAAQHGGKALEKQWAVESL